MKTLVLSIAFFVCAGITANAQTKSADSSATAKHQVQSKAAWACPACYKITKEGGVCDADKTAKIQLGTYYCQHCVKATGDKPGNCPMCKGATTQMTRRLCKEHTSNTKKTV